MAGFLGRACSGPRNLAASGAKIRCNPFEEGPRRFPHSLSPRHGGCWPSALGAAHQDRVSTPHVDASSHTWQMASIAHSCESQQNIVPPQAAQMLLEESQIFSNSAALRATFGQHLADCGRSLSPSSQHLSNTGQIWSDVGRVWHDFDRPRATLARNRPRLAREIRLASAKLGRFRQTFVRNRLNLGRHGRRNRSGSGRLTAQHRGCWHTCICLHLRRYASLT